MTGEDELVVPHSGLVVRRSSVVKRILVSASATALLQGLSLTLGFGTSIVLARLLGGAGYGRYVYALTWASLLAIPAILGLDRYLVRGIAVYEVEQRWDLMKGLLRRTNELVLLSSLTLAGVGGAVAVLWLSPALRWPLCIAMLLVPLTTLTLLRQGAMQAIGRVVTGQLPEYLIRPMVILIGIGILALVGHTLTPSTALAANVTGVLAAATVGAVLLKRALPPSLRSVRPSYATHAWMRKALPMMIISGVWMANNYCTTLVVGTLGDARSVGTYSVVQKGAELVVILLLAANMPLAPTIARMHARKDWIGLEHATERVAQATIAASTPVAAIFIIFPGIYLDIFGGDFRAGTTALVILAAGQLVNAAAGPAGNVLLMTGHERAAVRGVGLGLGANLALSIALVPVLGVTGGAIAFAGSLVLWNLIFVVLARRLVGINATSFRFLAMHRESGWH